ncbi:MAG: hypothetical protein WCY56_09465 [Aminobacteriaceae bacterium]
MLCCEVVVPGPWWNGLTYSTDSPVAPGLRVAVPLGRGERIGIVRETRDLNEDKEAQFTLRPIKGVLDEYPIFPGRLWELFEWGGRVFLCGTGELLRIASPSSILDSTEPVSLMPPMDDLQVALTPEELFLYSCRQEERWLKYTDFLEGKRGFIVLFPEQELARKFWGDLPKAVRNETILWPSQGGKRLSAAWNTVRNEPLRGVVGGPGAVFAPLRYVDAIIVDEESSGAYRTYTKPLVNIRTLAGKRARLESASLLLSGRVPSSRVFLRGRLNSSERPKRESIRFAGIKEAFAASLRGIGDSMPLTSALFSETGLCLSSGRTVLWLLDRKGYAGEIACEDCGSAVRCRKCGASVVWEEKRGRTRCPSCGELRSMPEECPACRGRLLTGKRPGLEAVFPVARGLVNEGQPALLLDDLKATGKRRLREITDGLSRGGIVLGTRAALSLCDNLDIGFIAWLDADAEVRSVAYQAKFTVFSMVWESIWRGGSADGRVVLLQSRRPGSGWQRGVAQGWSAFWKQELSERRELELPPFSYLFEIKAHSAEQKAEILASLEGARMNPMDPGDPPLVIWLSATSVVPVREALAPFFSIARSRRGFPGICVWID